MPLFGSLGSWFEDNVTHPIVSVVRKVTSTPLVKFSSAPLGIKQHTVDVGDVLAVGAVIAGGSALYAAGYTSGVGAVAAAGTASALQPVTGGVNLGPGEAASLAVGGPFGTTQSLPASFTGAGMLADVNLGAVAVTDQQDAIGYGAKPQSTGTEGFLQRTGDTILGVGSSIAQGIGSTGAAVIGGVASVVGAIAGDPNVAKTALGLGLGAAAGAIKSEQTPSQKLAQSIANNPIPWVIGVGVVVLLWRKS